jgi:hypothetical protein
MVIKKRFLSKEGKEKRFARLRGFSFEVRLFYGEKGWP